jgi:type VI secretion system protein ImpA
MFMPSSQTLLNFDDLLRPIPGENPSGKCLRYERTYDEIKKARHADDTLDRGEWQRKTKAADWDGVIAIAAAALAQSTKDLQIAAWLAEALVKKYGVPGVRDSLHLISELLAKFWDSLHPEIEDGDVEFRAKPLEWLSQVLPIAIEQTPLTGEINGEAYNWLHYQDALRLDNLARSNKPDDKSARENLIKDGKLTGAQFDAAVAATPREFYERLGNALAQSLERVHRLDEIAAQKFGNDAPGFRSIIQSLENCLSLVENILERKPKPQPHASETALSQGQDASIQEAESHTNSVDLPELNPKQIEGAIQEEKLQPFVTTSFEQSRASEKKMVELVSYVREVMQSELQTFLANFKELLHTELNEVKASVGANGRQSFEAEVLQAEVETAPGKQEPDVWSLAVAQWQSGKFQAGLALLKNALWLARSERERFLSKLGLAEFCLLANKPALARPIVEELVETTKAFRLDEWEDNELNVRVWRACHRCYHDLGENGSISQERMHTAFSRLCQLDVEQALTCME